MPKAFLIKKKHDAILASARTGIKRVWTDDILIECQENTQERSSSVSPAPSDIIVPDMCMPYDLSMKRKRVNSDSEGSRCSSPLHSPVSSPLSPPAYQSFYQWPAHPLRPQPLMPYALPFYYPHFAMLSPPHNDAVVPNYHSEHEVKTEIRTPSPPMEIPMSLKVSSESGKENSVTNRFQCEHCNKTYSTFSGLTKHRQMQSCTIVKVHSCEHCGKEYTSIGALKMHIKTHTLPCKCNICGKAFSRPWLLQGHIRTHTGEKPFQCDVCDRAFADRSNLRAHLQTHQNAKKFNCNGCNRNFSRAVLLQKHEELGCEVANQLACSPLTSVQV